MVTIHEALAYIRSIAPSLWRLNPDRVGIRVAIERSLGDTSLDVVTVSPTYEGLDGKVTTIADLPTHFFEVGPFESMGMTVEKATDGLIRILRFRALEICNKLARGMSPPGVEPRWVTKEGFTHIPTQMREDLRVEHGGPIWFLKTQGGWKAFTEEEVTKLIALGDDK